MPGSQRLPPSARLRRSSDIRTVFRQGRRRRCGPLEVYTLRSPARTGRIGVIVPKHGRSIVQRNRLKRRLREILRVSRSTEAGSRGRDVLVRARREAYEADFSTLARSLRDCFEGDGECSRG